jgi:hypothetical protein
MYDLNNKRVYMFDTDPGLPSSQPDLCWQIRIDGRAMQDDFGFYPIKMLVCSERAVKFLLNNHCTNIRGLKIQGDAKEFFDLYASHLKETNFNYRLPKVLDIDAVFSALNNYSER